MLMEWENELTQFEKKLTHLNAGNEEVTEKRSKYLNHIKHNIRAIQDMKNLIRSHEQFLEEFSEMGMDAPFDDEGHKKNKHHMKELEKRINKLTKKIKKLLDKE